MYSNTVLITYFQSFSESVSTVTQADDQELLLPVVAELSYTTSYIWHIFALFIASYTLYW